MINLLIYLEFFLETLNTFRFYDLQETYIPTTIIKFTHVLFLYSKIFILAVYNKVKKKNTNIYEKNEFRDLSFYVLLQIYTLLR